MVIVKYKKRRPPKRPSCYSYMLGCRMSVDRHRKTDRYQHHGEENKVFPGQADCWSQVINDANQQHSQYVHQLVWIDLIIDIFICFS